MNLIFKKKENLDERLTFRIDIHFSDKFYDAHEFMEIPAVDFDKAALEVERFARLLEACIARYPYGKGGQDGFTDIPDYYRYFDEDPDGGFDEDDPESLYSIYGLSTIDWPCYEYEYPKDIDSYTITYTDGDNQKFEVTL